MTTLTREQIIAHLVLADWMPIDMMAWREYTEGNETVGIWKPNEAAYWCEHWNGNHCEAIARVKRALVIPKRPAPPWDSLPDDELSAIAEEIGLWGAVV